MATAFAEIRQDRAGVGIALMLVAWLCFSVVDTTVKWFVLLGLPALQLAFVRYFVAFLFSLAAAAGRGPLVVAASRRDLTLLLIRSALLISATALNFFALKYLSLTVTSAIMFSSPIFVSALSMPLLGERVGPWRWAAIVLGFVGVLIVIRPFGETFHWASVLIVYNAIALALFSIITRKLSGTIPTQTMQLYMGAIGAAVLFPFALMTWQSPATPAGWALLVLIGGAAWFGHEIFSRAHAFAEANVLMPFSYSFIIYLTIASYLVFGDVPDAETIVGAMVIVGSGLIIWWREKPGRVAHVPR